MKPFDYDFILKQIDYWQLIKKLWEEADVNPEIDSLEVATFKLYLRLGSAKKVSDKLNELGYRVEGKNNNLIKLISNNVTDIIEKSVIPDKDLEKIVKEIQKDHKRYINKFF